jgi:16S rRNA (guanine527-N7)-methyltransferase
VSSAVDAQPPATLAEAAEQLFGANVALAVSYAQLLVTEGVVRGLLGPREAPRLWERHLLNCAAVAELIPRDSRVVDVGSGAGLPGIALAIARPDLSVVTVEPLARRAEFLSEVVAALDLSRTTVVRARAEERTPERDRFTDADIVTARAVAPLDRLASWCLPLAAVGGVLLAIKGGSAEEEVRQHRTVIEALGGSSPVVRNCGVGVIDPPTTVVEIVRRSVPRWRPRGR